MLTQDYSYPLPPCGLVGRVSGSPDPVPFEASGQQTLREWRHALSIIEKKFDDFDTIVDFGCGCGRVLRHLHPILRADQRLIGLDVDAEAISWIDRSYPGIATEVLNLTPPSTLQSESVDLIVNQSVFTHLPEDVQFAWLAELHRILKPSGIAILSFHGKKVWNDFCRDLELRGHASSIAIFAERFNRRGFFFIQGRSQLELSLPEYYGTAFHTISYIEEEWLRYFSLRAWLPRGSLDHQDLVVLSKA